MIESPPDKQEQRAAKEAGSSKKQTNHICIVAVEILGGIHNCLVRINILFRNTESSMAKSWFVTLDTHHRQQKEAGTLRECSRWVSIAER